jgi:hypothetical protein
MKKEKIMNWIKGILIIGGVPIVTLLIVLDNKSNIKAIKDNPAYAIGIVTHYSKGSRTIPINGTVSRTSSSVFVAFYVKNKKIKTDSKGMGPKSNQADCEGKNYVVIYDYKDPKKCVILFDYPVKDSADFIQAVEKLKINPPNIDR